MSFMSFRLLIPTCGDPDLRGLSVPFAGKEERKQRCGSSVRRSDDVQRTGLATLRAASGGSRTASRLQDDEPHRPFSRSLPRTARSRPRRSGSPQVGISLHRRLDDEIRAQFSRRWPDLAKIQRLKKMKLAVKDRLHRLAQGRAALRAA
jgi:uncharacterized protein